MSSLVPKWPGQNQITRLNYKRYLDYCTCLQVNILVIEKYLSIKDLRVGQWKEPCIGLTQENSIENSVQDCLPYVLIPNSLYKLFLAYPKWPCVRLKVNMCFTHCITSSFQNLLSPSMCYVTCDCIIWCDLLCDSVILLL